MVYAVINIAEEYNRVLNIVKAKYDLRNKSEAIEYITKEYMENKLEPQLRPEYVEKLKKIHKQKGRKFGSVDEMFGEFE